MNIQILKKIIKSFPSVYFALPMSTGILAIASYTLTYKHISHFLLYFNTVEMIILGTLIFLRALFYFDRFKKDLASLRRGGSFLAIVAALCVSGTAHSLILGNFTLGAFNWYLATAFWLIIIYAFLIFSITKKKKPVFQKGINGSWLLIIVSAQALSILGNMVAYNLGIPHRLVLLFTAQFYLLGILFYLIFIGLIFYRLLFFPLKPHHFQPTYWINMGAAAIITLSGTVLIRTMEHLGLFEEYIPITKAFSILFWTIATWWLPILTGLEIWKHRRIKVHFKPEYWSVIFPLGMYTVCTAHLAQVLQVPLLREFSELFIYIAWFFWGLIFLQMIRSWIMNWQELKLPYPKD